MDNKQFEEFQMQLDVLSGLVADMDEKNAHVIDVASGILVKLAATPDVGAKLLEPLQEAMQAFKKMSDSGFAFDAAYPELCEAVESLQKAAAATCEAEISYAAPQTHPRPAPAVVMPPEDVAECEINLDIIAGLLEDFDENNNHVIGVIADMLDKVGRVPSLPEGVCGITAAGAAAARELAAGALNAQQAVACISGAVAQVRRAVGVGATVEPETALPLDEAAAVADAHPMHEDGLDDDAIKFLEQVVVLLQDVETGVLAYEGGDSTALPEVAELLGGLESESAAYGLAGLGRAGAMMRRLLKGARLDAAAAGALLGARDVVFEHVNALLDGEAAVLNEARIAALTGGALDAAPKPEKTETSAEFPGDTNSLGTRAGITRQIPVMYPEDTEFPGDTSRNYKANSGHVPGIPRKLPEVSVDTSNPELRDFVTESREYLESAEAAIMALEKDPSSKENLNEIFRGFHNIKGISGFLNLKDVNELSHTAESLMDDAREGRIAFEGPVAQAAFEALDLLRAMVEGVDAALAGTPYRIPDGYAFVMDMLENPSAFAVANGTAEAEQDADAEENIEETEDDETGENAEVEARPAAPAFGAAPASVEDCLTAAGRKAKTNGMIKVSTTRLDNLIDAVGELVITNSMVMQEKEITDTVNPRLAGNVSLLSKITRELQEMAMSMRMMSLKSMFQKMARVARDLSVKSGTPIEFTFSGEDTELDRTVVEAIGSPLVHMVRNAVDHGIEPLDVRRALGKPDRGRIHLSAFHEGGNVIIKLEDDGLGLNTEKILAKARSLGIVSPDADLSDREIHKLIFAPGFSTADQITDVSGRGVGMDVVKKNIKNLRGRIDIDSEPGAGTRFYIRLPLTLAIIDGMVVMVGGERYIIPTIAIMESLRPLPDQIHTVTSRGEMLNLRGELMPLFRLYKLFNLDAACTDPCESLVVVITGEGSRCAVLVDELVGQQQVVIKTLGKTFDGLEGVSGGAIMGDGRVALILDTSGLVRAARQM